MKKIILNGTSDILDKLVMKYGDITILECITREKTEKFMKGGKCGYM